MGVNEKITRILKVTFDTETKEPMADVMVIDCMSAQFGGGKERPKTILAGDLGRATIK